MRLADANVSIAYGQGTKLSPIDRYGVWLSARAIRRHVPSFAGKRLGDFGCGYRATLAAQVLDQVREAILVDVALAPELKSHPRVVAIEGLLPEAVAELPDRSLDVILCISVLEHLWDPLPTLGEMRRLLAEGGVCVINVPTWRGKRFLEVSAFRLGMSPAEGVEDHKAYYDPRDLWPLLVRSGFRPREIKCFTHKFGLNALAVCRVGERRGR